MKKISANTILAKKAFPIFWFGFLGTMAIVALFSGHFKKDPASLIAPILMSGFGYYMMKYFVFNLMDNVYDCGDHLVVVNKKQTDKIYLKDIINISYIGHSNPGQVILKLRKESAFGTEVAFSPKKQFTLNLFSKNKIIEELILRVDNLRFK